MANQIGHRINIRVSNEEFNAYRIQAALHHVSLPNWIRQRLHEFAFPHQPVVVPSKAAVIGEHRDALRARIRDKQKFNIPLDDEELGELERITIEGIKGIR